MKNKSKSVGTPAAVKVLMEAEVARQVRQHARASMSQEVCGVLIGREEGSTTIVEACIAGAKAEQGGAHVTFTQETWTHIYAVKDREYPDARIVGWYHSHPGFGIFLSDHDTFIHQNFFSSPQQIAWVFDPHSDEEGCFGWHGGQIVRLDGVAFRYLQQAAAPAAHDDAAETKERVTVLRVPKENDVKWLSVARDVAIYALLMLAGAAGMFAYVSSRAHLLPRDVLPKHGPAMLIVERDSVMLVPPELAQHMILTLRREMNEVNASRLPEQQHSQASPGSAATSSPQEKNGR